MLAAETCLEAILANQGSGGPLGPLSGYQDRIEHSWIRTELYAARNFHQGFKRGRIAGMINAALGHITGGRGFGIYDRLPGDAGYERMEKLVDYFGRNVPGFERPKYDGKLTFNKLDDVFRSGTKHDENSPCHLHVADTNICATQCAHEFGNPCQYFCPAAVYEMVPAAVGSATITKNGFSRFGQALADQFRKLRALQDVRHHGPVSDHRLGAPEGGGGPVYTGL